MPQGGPWLPPHLGSLSCSSDRSHAPPCAGSGVPASPGAHRSLGSGAGAEPWPRRHCARARAGGAALSTGSCRKPRPVHPGAQPAARQLREGTGESQGQATLRLRVRGAAGTVGHHLRPSPRLRGGGAGDAVSGAAWRGFSTAVDPGWKPSSTVTEKARQGAATSKPRAWARTPGRLSRDRAARFAGGASLPNPGGISRGRLTGTQDRADSAALDVRPR